MHAGPPDLPDLDPLPPDIRAVVERQMAALAAERAARLHLESENEELKAHNTRLQHLVRELERARYGRRSEKLDPDQLELSLEDIEVGVGEAREAEEARAAARGGQKSAARPPSRTRSLPAALPRIERVIEPDGIRCPCGCGDMVRIGEDRSERLDIVPAQLRVIVTIRPRYACPKSRAGIVQAKAPAHLLEGALPTEALLAHVIVAKFSEHLPLYRQAQVFARHGLALDRSTLADWVGRASWHLAPVVDRMAAHLKRSGKLFMDETVAPVLDPGRGRTKTGYLWALARDDRGWGGSDPPGVVFTYAPGRGGAHAEEILDGFDGILQVDGYAGYRRLADERRRGGEPLLLAHCWAHARREVIKATPKSGSPVAEEILRRIAALYAVEADLRGQDPGARRAGRQERSRPLVDELGAWLCAQRERLSRRSPMGEAIAYVLAHWDGLRRFLDDGRIEMDSNPVENAIRPLALTRKNALFAGHDEGGRSWARLASLIGTCKMNGIEPYAYIRDTLAAIAAGHPQSRLDDLLPWKFTRGAGPA
jgi:transposase